MWEITKSQFLFLALVIFLCPTFVHAAVIKPQSADIKVEPGGAAVAEFAVGNEHDVEASVVIDVLGVNLNESGEPSFYDLDEQQAKNFVLDKNQITIKPGEIKNVFLTYNAPDQIDSQVVIAGVRFLERLPDQSGISAQKGFISLVFVTVGQGLIQQASLVDYSVADSVVSSLPVNFFITLKNEGDAVSQPTGYIELKNIFGARVDQIEINPKQQRVAPGTQRTLLVRWGNDIETQGLMGKLRNEVGQFTFGIFKAELNVYPWAGESMYSERTIVVFPWRIFLVAFGIFALLIVILKLIKRSSR